ncbi:MAG TPA: T9SS type A sorting domain-containing protein [Flavisolibacter sp.]|nr:T9SS type A sorting domain-containing protein [Flavisolibacter sp.]
MKQILLSSLLLPFALSLHAQKKQKPLTAYAITAVQKGQSSWTEVKLVDINTGDEVQSIYQSAQEIEILNARTGKPVVKKDAPAQTVLVDGKATTPQASFNTVIITRKDANGNVIVTERKVTTTRNAQYDKPFATNSAACAYDKKHDRLYYTPMGIAQLRYIDLKSKTPKVFYFEDEQFGVLKNRGDVASQITRMVIASDGNGYALSNDGNHLIQFTTGKKPQITDLGALSDDSGNGNFSVHSKNGYGGDMIADADKNLYLITANRAVFKISLESKVATYLGSIKGLPRGFTTNGAVVDEGSTVIVTSSSSTQGYFKFDLNTLEAEKVSSSASVFNASDLANGTLAFDKKKKKQREEKPEQAATLVEAKQQQAPAGTVAKTAQPEIAGNSISIYPNPVTNGVVKLAFAGQPEGRYQVQLLDVSGKLISARQVVINNKVQVVEYSLPAKTAAGNYFVRVVNETTQQSTTNKLVVQ